MSYNSEKNLFVLKCNPYTQKIEYEYFNSEKGTFCTPDISSDLAKDEFKNAVLWNKAYEIIDYINSKFNNGDIGLELLFEGTYEDYTFLKNVVEKYFSDSNITVPEPEKFLLSPESVKENIKKIFNEINPLFQNQKYSNSNINDQLKKFNDTINPTIPICVIGNYSAGKSAFINSLLGVELLKSADDPTTAKIYKIHSDKKRRIKFSYGYPKKIILTFNENKYRVDGGVGSKIVSELKEIEKYNSVEEKMYNALRIINEHNVPGAVSDIEITLPLKSPVLQFDKYDFVFYDTPGSNATSNKEHIDILKNSMIEQTNGLPIFITDPLSFDAHDTKKLVDTLNELGEALDKRNLIVICNRSDDASYDELKKKKENYKKLSISTLNPSGVYFVSSPLGLGFKKLIAGNSEQIEIEDEYTGELRKVTFPRFIDPHYKDTYDKNQKFFNSQHNPRCLYECNIISKISYDTYNELEVDDKFRGYRNSGIHAVECTINEFAEKYAQYNKCNNAIRFLSNAMSSLEKEIKKEKNLQDEISKKLSKKLDEKQKELLKSLTEVADRYKKNDVKSFVEKTISLMNEQIGELNKNIGGELREIHSDSLENLHETGIINKKRLGYLNIEKFNTGVEKKLKEKIALYWSKQISNANGFWPQKLESLKLELIKIITNSNYINDEQKRIITKYFNEIKTSFSYTNKFEIGFDIAYKRERKIKIMFWEIKHVYYSFQNDASSKSFMEEFEKGAAKANEQIISESTDSYNALIKDIKDQFSILINLHNPNVINLKIQLKESQDKERELNRQKELLNSASIQIADMKYTLYTKGE